MRNKKRKKAAGQVMAAVILVVCALAMLAVLTFSQIFVVRDVIVVGNRNLLSEEVITQSGVQVGENRLNITNQRLKHALEKNRYIEYTGCEFDYRGTLTLYIRERLGRAVVNGLGVMYMLDETGMVLDCLGKRTEEGYSVPEIEGFDILPKTSINEGEWLPVNEEQLSVMQQVLSVLEDTGMLGRIEKVNLSNLREIQLKTREGAAIALGGPDKLMTKVLIGREVLSIHEKEGSLKGVKIDVGNGRRAYYIPENRPTFTPVPTATPGPGATPAQ